MSLVSLHYLVKYQCLKSNNTLQEINDRKQPVYCLSYYPKQLSHSAVFTSNVQCARLAAGRRTQAGDATDQ